MNNKIKFLVLIISLFLLWYLARYFHFDAEALQASLKKIPLFYSGAVFVFLYCLVTFFIWFSKDAFRLIAAVLFGAVLSTIFIFIAEALNAFILFYIARILGRNFVVDSLKGKCAKLDAKIGKSSFLWLFIFRAMPLIPFRFLDLSCGLTRISFKRYFLAVILGSPLRIFWVQYILAGVGLSILSRPEALVNYLLSNKPAFIFSLIYFVLVIAVVLSLKLRSRKDGG